MLWRVDPSSGTPLFEQVAASVRRALLDGDLAVGEKLPAARDVAEALDVNIHTVLRAYQVLRDEGLVELRRGRGAVVLAADLDRTQLGAQVDRLLAEAKRLGLASTDVIKLIEERS